MGCGLSDRRKRADTRVRSRPHVESGPVRYFESSCFLRQRRKCLAFCLGVTGFTSPPIGEALSLDALHGEGHAFGIADAVPDALVVSKIELGQIAFKVLLAYMLINAGDAALEDGKIVLDRIGVPEPAAYIFIDGMIDRPVAREFAPDADVGPGFIGH